MVGPVPIAENLCVLSRNERFLCAKSQEDPFAPPVARMISPELGLSEYNDSDIISLLLFPKTRAINYLQMGWYLLVRT